MKKLMTLALAAAMMLGAATGANAIDFKAKGQWIMDFNYGMHGDFAKSKAAGNSGFSRNGNHEDEFEATQRVRLQLDAVASEALSGTVFFEIGDQVWGDNDNGGALGADGKFVELKRAYIDWMVPQTDLKVRMGIQGLALPSFTTNASQIIDDDVAAITLNYQFNENVGLTAREFSPSFRPPYCRTISRDNLTFPATSICRVAKKSLVVALPYSQMDPAHRPVTAATSPASRNRTQKKRCTRPPCSLLQREN